MITHTLWHQERYKMERKMLIRSQWRSFKQGLQIQIAMVTNVTLDLKDGRSNQNDV